MGTKWSEVSVVILLMTFDYQLDLTWSLTQTSSRFPSVSIDYKVELPPKKEDCYYQFVLPNSVVHINFQVIRGGDLKAGFLVRQPNGTVVMDYEWRTENSWDTRWAMGGYYTLCINNEQSQFHTKLIAIYMDTFFASHSMQYLKELGEIQLTAANFSRTLSEVDANLASVRKTLHRSRATEARDLAIRRETNYYVNFWSLAQCLVVMATGGLQIYFIKNLFEAPNTLNRRVHVYKPLRR